HGSRKTEKPDRRRTAAPAARAQRSALPAQVPVEDGTDGEPQQDSRVAQGCGPDSYGDPGEAARVGARERSPGGGCRGAGNGGCRASEEGQSKTRCQVESEAQGEGKDQDEDEEEVMTETENKTPAGRRATKIGQVVSTKMQKTIVVEVIMKKS